MSAARPEAERIAAGLASDQAWGWLLSLRRFARYEPVGLAALALLVLLFLIVFVGPFLVPSDPLQISLDETFISPGFGTEHWLGTDQLGRDVLARVLEGGRFSLSISFGAIVIGIGAGAVLGLTSGFVSGWLAQVLERFVDGMMAIPPLILALAIATALGNSGVNIMVSIAIVMAPTSARVVRGATLSVRGMDYVTAATAMGANGPRIVARHILPNVAGTIITVASIWVGAAILIEASLGFIGIGRQPPLPSWGNMLAGEGRSYMVSSPWLAIVPGVAISITVLAFNMLGDSLRSFFDPKSRGRL